MTAEPDEIDHRIRRLWSDWRSLPRGNGSECVPLATRPVGRWMLPRKREEMLTLIGTLCELGDLSIETHPKLLLVRPEQSAPNQLDQRLEQAGYSVVTAPEEHFNDVMTAYSPDAVVVACEDEAETAINQSIATSMESVAKIPVVLMTAAAKTIQLSLRGMKSLEPLDRGGSDA